MTGIEGAIIAAIKDAPIAAVVCFAIWATQKIVISLGGKSLVTINGFTEALSALKEAVDQLITFMLRLNGRLTQATIDHVVEGEGRRLEDSLTSEEVAALRMKIEAEEIAEVKRNKERK
jgi:hypothetical protein